MIYFAVALFVFGVLFVTYVSNFSVALFCSVGVSFGLFLYGVLRRIEGRNTKTIGIALIAMCFFVLGAFRMDGFLQNDYSLVYEFNNTYQILEGRIESFPEERETKTRVVLDHIVHQGIELEKSFKVLVWIPKTERVRVKDKVEVKGIVRVPESFETDTGRVFDYTNYLAKDDIYLEMLEPQEVRVSPYDGFSLLRILEGSKKFFLLHIEAVLPEPHSSLAGGILLGEKQSLGDLWQERFRVVGLTHIVVLSGYNIAIVVGLVLFLLSGLSLVWSSIFGLIGIILFALLVGGGATVVRASLMASLLIVARYFHRPYDALRGLCIAGGVMVCVNPRILIYDLSFQLSFLATLGIILYTPILDKWCARIPKRFGLREVIVTTFSAQLFVLPWIAYAIGDFSVVSFVANILVLPVIPLTMLFSFIAGIVPFTVVAVPAYILLHYVLKLTEMLSTVPFASVTVPQIPLVVVVVLVYGILITFPVYTKRIM